MVTSKEQLDEFLDYPGQDLTRMQSLCNSAHDGQFRSSKKALLYSFIDNLSGLEYPTIKKDSARARKLMTQYGRWARGSLVSTRHLCRWIEVIPKGLLQGGKELTNSGDAAPHPRPPSRVIAVTGNIDPTAHQPGLQAQLKWSTVFILV